MDLPYERGDPNPARGPRRTSVDLNRGAT